MMSTESRGAEQMKASDSRKLVSGKWYHLYYPKKTVPVLVYCLFNMDYRCTGFAYNYMQGGNFTPLIDLDPDVKIIPVTIIEEPKPIYKNYRKKLLQPMRPYILGEDLSNVSINAPDIPGEGGMIVVNPDNPNDLWYISKKFCEDNYELAEE